MTTDERKPINQFERSLIDIAVESWRFSRLFARVVQKLDAGEASRYVNQLRYFQKKVEESFDATGLKLVNVEGQPFDPGMARRTCCVRGWPHALQAAARQSRF